MPNNVMDKGRECSMEDRDRSSWNDAMMYHTEEYLQMKNRLGKGVNPEFSTSPHEGKDGAMGGKTTT